MERLVGKYCKIVTKEPGEERANVVTGILEDVDYKDGFILVDSDQGLGCLRINTIVAIKPGKKRPVHKKIKNDKEAVVGIGTLIIFIAMILVAAVAASVIIQTQETLQQRAYAVGKQTIRDVSSGIRIIGVTGYTNAVKTRIEKLAIAVTARAGSKDIDLNGTLLYLQYNNFSVLSIDLDNVASGVSESGVFQTLAEPSSINDTNLTATEYGVIAVHDPEESIVNNKALSTDSHAILIVNLTALLPTDGGLLPGEEISGRLVPEFGSSGIFLINTPNSFTYRIVEL